MNLDRAPITALVTGASRGIGLQIARHLAPLCADLVVASRTQENISKAAERLSAETKCRIHSFWGDLADGRRTTDALRAKAESTVKRIDLLVVNAGYFVEGALAEIADADFEKNMMVNCHSAHYVVTALLPLLRKSSHARIVIIGSTAAYEPYPLVPTYGVAKWALRGYAINLRRELMAANIGVTFVSPGGTLTDMWAGVDLPPGRLLEPSDIGIIVESLLKLSPQAVVDEIIIRPMLGDIHE